MSHKIILIANTIGAIVLIVILACLVTVMALSSAPVGKNSEQSLLRVAISSIRAERTAKNIPDFSGISTKTLTRSEPDIVWINGTIDPRNSESTISFTNLDGKTVGVASLYKEVCYYAVLDSVNATLFGSKRTRSCTSKNAIMNATSENSDDGWNL